MGIWDRGLQPRKKKKKKKVEEEVVEDGQIIVPDPLPVLIVTKDPKSVHAQGKITGRVYTLRWITFCRQTLRIPPAAAAEDDNLRKFHTQLVDKIERFNEDAAKFQGGAREAGWSLEECDPVMGLPALEVALEKA